MHLCVVRERQERMEMMMAMERAKHLTAEQREQKR